jgi:hypothetical protein
VHCHDLGDDTEVRQLDLCFACELLERFLREAFSALSWRIQELEGGAFLRAEKLRNLKLALVFRFLELYGLGRLRRCRALLVRRRRLGRYFLVCREMIRLRRRQRLEKDRLTYS